MTNAFRILHVEGDPADAVVTEKVLSELSGSTVTTVTTLAEARRHLKSPARYDILLCNLQLPDGDGLSLLEHVRTRRLPLATVVLTGANDERDAVRAMALGANDFVQKNYDDWSRLPLRLHAAVQRCRAIGHAASVHHLLYVEDNEADVRLTCRALSECVPPFEIDTFDSADKLQQYLKERVDPRLPWDIILIDYSLPGTDGLELAHWVRERYGPDLPIVLVTGRGEQKVVAEAVRLGVTQYIIKEDSYYEQLPAKLQIAIDRAQRLRHERELTDARQQLDHMLASHSTILFRSKVVNGHPIMPPIWVSANILDVLGYTADEAKATPDWILKIIPEGDSPKLRVERDAFRQTGYSQAVVRFRHKDGRIRWIKMEGRVVSVPGNPDLECVSSWNDITDLKESELRLAESEAKFRLMAETMEDVIWQATPDMIYTYISPSIEQQRGFRPEEVIGRSVLDFVPAEARPAIEQLFAELRSAGIQWRNFDPMEFRFKTKDGSLVWVETVVGPITRDGVVTGYQGVSRNVSQRKQMEERMEFLTNNDALTGLPNRKLLESRLAHALETARAFDQKLAILLLDLDHFKNINDSLGHDVGDEMLKKVASCLSRVLHPGDTLARLGGDEFAILLEQKERTEDIGRLAQELLDSLDNAITLPNGADVDIGASIGISLFPDHGVTVVELLQYADSALYRAKSEGRRTFRFFSEELTRAARERLSVETKLRHALERNELEVYYQPILDIRTRAIAGAEALLRWRTQDGTLIMPDRFIPLAEESGLILPIGEWVMRTASRQMREWNRSRAAPLFIAINLSTKQFVQAGLSDQVQRILDETGLPGSLLELEITESAMMPEGEHAGVLLERLKQTGARLAIDDFGTGYSSLAYLQRFPFDTLKIDRRFVNNINERSDDTVVVNSIIRLAQSLNLKLLAEGVETLGQLKFLQAQSCDLYQGFLFSKAVPATEFRALMQEGKQSPE